jgi:VWFA-related protein
MKVLLAFPLALLSLAAPSGQTPQTPFRSGTEMVPVFTTVRDRDRLVTDLTKEDFTITDNGKVQEIAYFSNDVGPFSVVLMLDRSRSMFAYQREVRDAASAFVRQLLPTDYARVGSFGDNVGNRIVIKPSIFTSSKGELLDILNAPLGLGGGSPVLISIDQSINALMQRQGRRVVIIFSDGYDEAAPSMMAVSPKVLIERARQADVLVYALGFVRVQTRGDDKPATFTPPSPVLQQLADETGGGYFTLQGEADMTATFTRVADELHRQYWLAFAPQVRDGKVHSLQVRVRNKDLTVRARPSYQAPPPAR